MTPVPRLLTIKEACVYLFGQFTPSIRNRMYHLIEANELPTVRDGRKYYLPRTVLDELAEGRR